MGEAGFEEVTAAEDPSTVLRGLTTSNRRLRCAELPKLRDVPLPIDLAAAIGEEVTAAVEWLTTLSCCRRLSDRARPVRTKKGDSSESLAQARARHGLCRCLPTDVVHTGP